MWRIIGPDGFHGARHQAGERGHDSATRPDGRRPHPVYIQGHYNCTNSARLGNTEYLLQPSGIDRGRVITILSSAWNDATATSSSSLSSRVPNDTTVNAAFITGIVQTSSTNGYSGGVENLPRFLEDWAAAAEWERRKNVYLQWLHGCHVRKQVRDGTVGEHWRVL